MIRNIYPFNELSKEFTYNFESKYFLHYIVCLIKSLISLSLISSIYYRFSLMS